MPPELERELAGRPWRAVHIGMSNAEVFRFEAGLYLKTARRIAHHPAFGTLEDERRRLEWLSGKLPVPSVVAFARDEGRDYLVLSEVPGRHAAEATPAVDQTPARIEALAAACRMFHELPVGDCPFVASADALIQHARARLELGLVEAEDFDAERRGRDAADLFQELVASRPFKEDCVVTHGDFCLPNIILREHDLSGFIDVGRAGVSDRWRDLALCARSIEHNWGVPWSDAFFDAYGVPHDRDKQAFYLILDEFF